MSWYDEAFRQRKIITHRNEAPASSLDIDVTIPPDWDEFWETIDDDGNELRVTLADGLTLLDYGVDDGAGGSFDKANRLGRLRLDAVPVVAEDNYFPLFVYFDTGDDPQGDASVSTTMSTPTDGYIDLGSPAWADAAMIPERAGSDQPQTVITATPGSKFHVWVDVSAFLELRHTPFAGWNIFEEPYMLEIEVLDDTGADATSDILDPDQVRFVETLQSGSRTLALRIPVGASTALAGEGYTIRPRLSTVYPPAAGDLTRTGILSVGLQIVDPLEPAAA